MQVSVTFRKIEASDTLRNYAEDKLYRVKKYVEDPIDAHVVLSVEKFRHIAEVSVDANGLRLNGVEETEDMYSAIDMAVDKIESQIKRYRQKLKKRKSDASSKDLVMRRDVLAGENLEESEEPQVIKTKQVYVKPMDPDEALMQMNLVNSEFLVFTNAKTQTINVIYRRKDGNYGLIEPVT
ncbi:MAG: ribosome-associated translation inhibitor RaiA [Deltaproteobacteria bacterium]|nr:MAG: ribosome-associated translation inhibitor RaiA [Deltaproteobacteria bacterium]